MQSARGKTCANRELAIAQARDIWFGWNDPNRRRSYQAVSDKLWSAHGHRTAKSTIERWSKTWIAGTSAQVLVPQATPAELALFANLPEELRKALDPRLGILAKTAGLDALENMILKYATELGNQAADLSRLMLDPEAETSTVTKTADGAETATRTQRAKAALTLGTLTTQFASALQMIQAARSMPSLAHRNFAEGDMLAGQGSKARGEGEKFTAEAVAITEQRRPATEVDGTIIDQTQDEKGAIAALRNGGK